MTDMKLDLTKQPVGKKLTLAVPNDKGLPVPFTATVAEMRPNTIKLIAKYNCGGAELEIDFWMPHAWMLHHVKESRNTYWLPRILHQDLHPAKKNNLIL